MKGEVYEPVQGEITVVFYLCDGDITGYQAEHPGFTREEFIKELAAWAKDELRRLPKGPVKPGDIVW